MKNYFSNHYSQIQGIDSNLKKSISEWYQNVIVAYNYELKPYIKQIEGKSVLEIGCGIGGLLNYLKEIGHKTYFGVDQSEEQIDLCKKYVTDRVVKMEASEFLMNNKIKYDFIIMFDLIEHIKKEKIVPLLKLVLKTLTSNGKVLIRTPNMGSLISNHSRYIDITHEVGFTEESLSQVLHEAGFTKVKCANNALGKKRLLFLKFFHFLVNKIYLTQRSNVHSPNILALAEKD